MSKFIHFIIFQFLFFHSSFASESALEVTITQGKLEGIRQQSSQGKTFFSFLGIPYAKPPVGELRFQPPEPADSWTGVRDAKTPGADCLQFESFLKKEVAGEEDCLFINVYTKQIHQSPKLPVLVFIHGGGFKAGSGSPSLFYGPEFIMNRDVVLVTLNYRLGVLGFLSTATKILPGNMGLKDQSLALKWVQKNIASFGGDPNEVTIFGESAGAASVHYQMLSPLSKGLFHRAISMSGTALCSWAFVNSDMARKMAEQISEALNCPTTYSDEMVECLRKIDGKELVNAAETLTEDNGLSFLIPFGPTVEEKGSNHLFLPETPYDLVRKGLLNDVPWVTGFTSNEGLLFYLVYTSTPNIMEALKEDYKTALPTVLDLKYRTKDPKAVGEIIKRFYYGDKGVDEENIKEMAEMTGDRMFVHGIYEAARLQMKSGVLKSPIYMYKLSASPSQSSSIMGLFIGNRDFTGLGVGHGEDLAFIFQHAILSPISTAEDLKVSNHFLDMMVNFANTGNPNSKNSSKWKKLTPEFHYTDIDYHLKIKDDFPIKTMNFLSSLPIADGGKLLKDVREEL